VAVLCAAALCTMATPALAAAVFQIRGGGDGHGIGMSQYGAYGYALHGWSYRAILGHYYSGTGIGTTDPNRTVRVLLASGPAAFSGATAAGAKSLHPGTTYRVQARSDGSLLLLDGAGNKIGVFAAPLRVSGSGPLTVAGLGLYRGALEFRPDGGGGVETVDALALEDYVRGVISAEMPAGWSAPALEVQAVAARTYAITTDAGGAAFDQYADTRSQMYRGVAAETAATDAAVAATRGQVVTYHGVPVVTYFFNSSGGHTENIENVWAGSTPEPWLRGVPDPYDGVAGDPYHAWGSERSLAAAQAALGGLVKGSLIGIRVTRHGSSPRILTAEVLGSKGNTSVTGTQLQQVFGLLTTSASFTSISTSLGASVPSPFGGAGGGAPVSTVAGAQAIPALVALVRSIVAGTVPTLTGWVFPARSGDPFALQLRSGGAWHTIARDTLGRGGWFSVHPSRLGSYRIVYRGLDGPAVTIR
jgi:stage II sporulation protein D